MWRCKVPQFDSLVIWAWYNTVVVELKTRHTICVTTKSQQTLSTLQAPHLKKKGTNKAIIKKPGHFKEEAYIKLSCSQPVPGSHFVDTERRNTRGWKKNERGLRRVEALPTTPVFVGLFFAPNVISHDPNNWEPGTGCLVLGAEYCWHHRNGLMNGHSTSPSQRSTSALIIGCD